MRIFSRKDDAGRGGDGGSPVASYAAVLDGDHLWWHVEGHDRLALRDVATGGEIEVAADRFSLAGLTGDGYHVLADGQPVRAPDLPDRDPSRTPLSADSSTQYDVTQVDGHLRLTRQSRPAAVVLEAVELGGARIRLRITAPTDPGVSTLLLLDADDRVVASRPAETGGRALNVEFEVADLPTGYVGVLRVAVGTANRWRRVRRADTGLVDPNHAVLLPELPDPERPEQVRARLRWSPDSLLALRLLVDGPSDQP